VAFSFDAVENIIPKHAARKFQKKLSKNFTLTLIVGVRLGKQKIAC